MRKMASIRKISGLRPIPGADNIECARVDGWDVVVKKGEFQVGDLCVYCEIDSLLPEKEEFEFMRPRKFRVKTIKLRGQISQGLVFPLDVIPSYKENLEQDELEVTSWADNYQEGMDVSEELGIIKWEPTLPEHLRGHTKGTFPGFLPKTDEERVQNLGRTLENILKEREVNVYITEKLHGTSFTAYLRDGEFGVCSRNQEKKDEEGCLYWSAAKKMNLEWKLRQFARIIGVPNVACQGELCGPGINGNTLGLNEHKIFMFDFFDIDKYEYFSFNFFDVFASFGFSLVPVLKSEVPLHADVDKWVQSVDGMETVFPGKQAEGIVVRAVDERGTDRISFKVINNSFLLKNKDA